MTMVLEGIIRTDEDGFEELAGGLRVRKIKINSVADCRASEKLKCVPGLRESLSRMKYTSDIYSVTLALALFLLLQIVVSTGHYSGYNTPPMYGDFEAQRHWMELTVNLPTSQWYVNSTENDLNYWGLDYPPLTAYHSWLLGKISAYINPDWVELHVSRGLETPEHKLFMRCSAIATMCVLYAPAMLLLQWRRAHTRDCATNLFRLVATLCYPGLLFIDNGHFQYNHIALGLFLWSVYCFQTSGERPHLAYVGSVLFTLAVNFKQMQLYHSLPVFVLLLSRCIPRSPPRVFKSLWNVAKVGAAVCVTFGLLWLPFMLNGVDSVVAVLIRLFPLKRGIFEDKVANFWCAISVPIKVKTLFPAEKLATASSAMVLVSLLPSLYILFRRPSDRNFRLCLAIAGLSFFLFSFQVHEKSILMAAIPSLLLLDDLPTDAIGWFLSASLVSLYPLCVKDKMPEILPLFVTYHFFLRTEGNDEEKVPRLSQTLFHAVSFVISIALCLSLVLVTPPQRYPHLFELLVAVFSFGRFSLFWLYLNYQIIKWSSLMTVRMGEKKRKLA